MTTLEYESQHIKQAGVDYPIHPLLRQRWSPNAFDPRPVEPAKLRSVLEAARWSASAGNSQPWHFIVVTQEEPEEIAKLAACMSPGNAEWAVHAPVLVLTVASMVMSNGRVYTFAFHDVGLATQNLTLQATALGLYVHSIAVHSADTARELFAIPEGHNPVTMLAVGYLGDPESLAEQRREQELTRRTRKPLRELVFSRTWGNTAELVQ